MKNKKNIVILSSCLLNILLIVVVIITGKKNMVSTESISQPDPSQELITLDDLKKYDEYDYPDLMNNPIDQAYLSHITKNISQIEIRDLQARYEEIWKEEYEKALKIIKDKAVYQEDLDNINKFNEHVVNFFDENKTFFETIVLNDFSDPSLPEKNSYGNGTTNKLLEIRGKIYRNACMQIITVLPDGEYKYPENNLFDIYNSN